MNKIALYVGMMIVLLLPRAAEANNIAVSNATVTGRNTSAGTNNAANFVNVKFDCSWDNSWRYNSSNGSLSYISVKTGGTGYSATPTVSFSGGGGGSGAAATATVTSGVITGFTITNAGSGYTSIPTVTITDGTGTGASADAYVQSWWDAAWVFIKFRVGDSDPVLGGASSSGTTVTVSSTSNLRAGMPVTVTTGTGAFAAGTVISSITNSTQFVVSASPTTPLSAATVRCVRIWEHASLNNTGHTAPTGSTLDVGLASPGSIYNSTTNPGVGVFMYRSSAGTGSNSFTNAQLRWNYGINGLRDIMAVSIQVFAIEMVYVPQGSFYLGDGSATALAQFSTATSLTTPYQVARESQLTVGGTTAGNLRINTAPAGRDNGLNEDFSDATSQNVPAAYPKGYAAFYCMKHELTQGMYRNFLNTLTYTQQALRTLAAFPPTSAAGTSVLVNPSSQRTALVIASSAASAVDPAVYGCNLNGNSTYNESADGEWIACGYLNFGDVTAFMDWAGLRPMSEFEYEKSARGPVTPVANEYAWGTTSITAATGPSNSGTTTEVSSTSTANSSANASIAGPLRVGSFAATGTNRQSAGASYYGILDLTGNVWERVIPVSDATGRAYTGQHGNGSIGSDGNHNVSGWPGGGSTAGYGLRGGRYSNTTFLMTSDRTRSLDPRTSRVLEWNGRGVRTAPPDVVTSGLLVNYDAGNTASYPGSGTTWTDLSGNGTNATLVNGPTFDASNGGCIVFDGTNDYASLTRPSAIVTGGAITVSVWVRWTTTGTSIATIQAIVDNNHTGSQGFVIQDRPDLTPKIVGFNGANSTYQVGDGTWHHVVGTNDQTNSKVYIDGVLHAQVAQAGMPNVQALITLGCWQSGPSRFLNGRIAQFQMYSRALTADEVMQNFLAHKSRYGL